MKHEQIISRATARLSELDKFVDKINALLSVLDACDNISVKISCAENCITLNENDVNAILEDLHKHLLAILEKCNCANYRKVVETIEILNIKDLKGCAKKIHDFAISDIASIKEMIDACVRILRIIEFCQNPNGAEIEHFDYSYDASSLLSSVSQTLIAVKRKELDNICSKLEKMTL